MNNPWRFLEKLKSLDLTWVEDGGRIRTESGREPIQAVANSDLPAVRCYADAGLFWWDAKEFSRASDDPEHPWRSLLLRNL